MIDRSIIFQSSDKNNSNEKCLLKFLFWDIYFDFQEEICFPQLTDFRPRIFCTELSSNFGQFHKDSVNLGSVFFLSGRALREVVAWLSLLLFKTHLETWHVRPSLKRSRCLAAPALVRNALGYFVCPPELRQRAPFGCVCSRLKSTWRLGLSGRAWREGVAWLRPLSLEKNLVFCNKNAQMKDSVQKILFKNYLLSRIKYVNSLIWYLTQRWDYPRLIIPREVGSSVICFPHHVK